MFLISLPLTLDSTPILTHVVEAPQWKTTSSDISLTTKLPTTTNTSSPTTPMTTTDTPSSPTTYIPAPSLTTAMCNQVGPGKLSEVLTCQQPDGYIVTAKRADLLPKDRAYEDDLKTQLCEAKPWLCQ